MKYINDCIIPVCNNLTTVGEVETLAKIIFVGAAVGEVETLAMIISVGVAVGAPGAMQQALYEGLALQASAKSGEVQ